MGQLMSSLLGYLRKTLSNILDEKSIATGFPPHFGITCDKSTPLRETNQAVMILLVVDGVRKAIPIGAPVVYSSSQSQGTADLEGGTADELGNQVIDTLKNYTKCKEETLCQVVGKRENLTV